jgi:sugar phosphate isomerase/epimerase
MNPRDRIRPLPFGVRVRDLPEAPFTPADAISCVARRGCAGIQFPSLTWISPDLDRGALREAGAHAADAGLTASVALGVLNAAFPERSAEVAALAGGDVVAGAERLIRAAEGTGIDALHLTVGQLEDRFLAEPSYESQCARTAELLARLAPAAEEAGVTLVLKTHEEMSSHEAVAIVAGVGSPAVRIGFSPVNLLVLAEEPLAAARRVMPLVHTVFVDDAAVASDPAGLRRVMLPLGEGDIDWPAILALSVADGSAPQIVLDIHRAMFDVPFLREGWLDANPHVAVRELVALMRNARPASLAQDDDAARRFERGVAGLSRTAG